jgi:hypothetical protein
MFGPVADKCAHCGSTELHLDERQAMVPCSNCGVVAHERMVTYDADWGIGEDARADPFPSRFLGTRAAGGPVNSGRDPLNWLVDKEETSTRCHEERIAAIVESQLMPEGVTDTAAAAYAKYDKFRIAKGIPGVRGLNRDAMYAACIFEAAKAQGMGVDVPTFIAKMGVSRRQFCTQHKTLLMTANVQVTARVTNESLASEAEVCVGLLGLSNTDGCKVRNEIERACAEVPAFKTFAPAVKVGCMAITLASIGRIPPMNTSLVASRLKQTRDNLMKKAKAVRAHMF